MKLTKEHTKELYIFTRKHFVYHYDVQTELVDHLANDIEDLWSKSPGLTFEDARDKSFKKFGVFGFMDVLEAKQKQMNKRYWKIILRFGKEWFTIPKTMTTIFIFLGFYFFLQLQYAEFIFIGTLLTLILVEFILLFKSRKLNKIKELKKEKKFLLEDMIGQTRKSSTVLCYINLIQFTAFPNVFLPGGLNIYWLLFFSVVLTLLSIIFYITNYVIPQKAEELLTETYPEYKMVKTL